MKDVHQVTIHFPLDTLERFDELRKRKEHQNPGAKVSRGSLTLYAVEQLLASEGLPKKE